MPDDIQNAAPAKGGTSAKAAKQDTAGAQNPAPADAELTLDQFGLELSQRDTRVELLNAFVVLERSAGNHKDTEAGYQARFDAFLNKPV